MIQEQIRNKKYKQIDVSDDSNSGGNNGGGRVSVRSASATFIQVSNTQLTFWYYYYAKY